MWNRGQRRIRLQLSQLEGFKKWFLLWLSWKAEQPVGFAISVASDDFDLIPCSCFFGWYVVKVNSWCALIFLVACGNCLKMASVKLVSRECFIYLFFIKGWECCIKKKFCAFCTYFFCLILCKKKKKKAPYWFHE